MAIQKTLQQLLWCIEWDEEGVVQRQFSLIQLQQADAPRALEIDPRLSFGRPAVVNTGIPADMVLDRFKAGERLELLADDYDFSRQQLEEILDMRWFYRRLHRLSGE